MKKMMNNRSRSTIVATQVITTSSSASSYIDVAMDQTTAMHIGNRLRHLREQRVDHSQTQWLLLVLWQSFQVLGKRSTSMKCQLKITTSAIDEHSFQLVDEWMFQFREGKRFFDELSFEFLFPMIEQSSLEAAAVATWRRERIQQTCHSLERRQERCLFHLQSPHQTT